MLRGIKLRMAALGGSIAMVLAVFAGTASAQQQEGLINLAVTDVNV